MGGCADANVLLLSGHAKVAEQRRREGELSAFVSVFRSSSRQVKGWRRLDRRRFRRNFGPTSRPLSPTNAKGHPAPRTKAAGPEDKTRRSIRRAAGIRPLKRARTGFEPWAKRTGASPSCLQLSHDACLFSLIPSFAQSEADHGRFPSGACGERLSSSDG
jgi:hypothetical protein